MLTPKMLFGTLGSHHHITYVDISKLAATSLQSLMDDNRSQQRIRPCHENGQNKTIQTITHNLFASFKSSSPVSKPLLTEFGILQSLESFVAFIAFQSEVGQVKYLYLQYQVLYSY